MATLYYDGITAGIDFNWGNVSRWYSDAGLSIPAGAIPSGGDSVYLYGKMDLGPVNSGGSPVTLIDVNVSGTSGTAYTVEVYGVTATNLNVSGSSEIISTGGSVVCNYANFTDYSVNRAAIYCSNAISFHLGSSNHGGYATPSLLFIGGSAVCDGVVSEVNGYHGADFTVMVLSSGIIGGMLVF